MITRYLDGQYYDRNTRAQHPLYQVSPSSSRAERENALREDSLREVALDESFSKKPRDR